MISNIKFISIVISLMVGFCFVDTLVDAWFFSDGRLDRHMLHPPAGEIYMRSVVCLLILIAAIFKRVLDRRQHRLTDALMASESLHRDLIDNCPDSIIVHRDNQILYLNDVALGYLGATDIDDLPTRILNDYIHPDDIELSQDRRTNAITGQGDQTAASLRFILPGEQERNALVTSSRIVFEGQPAVLTFCHDVTMEVATQKNLYASQERLRLALEAAQDGIWDWDMVNDKVVYNRAWAEMLGLEAGQTEHTPATWANLVHPDDKQRALEASEAHARGESRVFEVEVRLRHADGHYIWVLDRGKVVETAANGSPVRMTGTHRNITARKEAEIALEIRNRIAEMFLTSTGDDVFANILPLIGKAVESPVALLGVLDAQQKAQITSFDSTSNHRSGLANHHLMQGALPEMCQDIVSHRSARIINEKLALTLLSRPVSRSVTVPIISKSKVLGFLMVADRNTNYTDADSANLGSLASYLAPILEFQMESEEKESQLRQAQKMEAIGALAGGIAHDFNNILQAILGFSTLALEEAQEQDSRHGGFIANDLERVVRATQRGRELVNRILLFSRRQEQEQQLVDLHVVVTDAVDLLTNTIPATIEVQTEMVTDCGSVLADPAQISQVIMNLATNSFHAMEADGGKLTFTLRPVPANSEDPLVPAALSEHELVCLTVADTGSGMDTATLARLYDPFFTTKEVGKGTGLGLSVVHGIVAAHSGEIVIESSVGQGTSAHVFLPVLVEAATETLSEQIASVGLSPAASPVTGSRILFLDDEFDITALGKALLEKQGHQVLTLNDSLTALEYLRQAPRDFDLLITDLTMPHMTGLQLADEVGQIRPDLPVVLITGLNDMPTDVYEKNSQIQGVLRKPFGGNTLRETVQRVLLEARDV